MSAVGELSLWFWVVQRGGCWGDRSFAQSLPQRSPMRDIGRFYSRGLRLVRRTP